MVYLNHSYENMFVELYYFIGIFYEFIGQLRYMNETILMNTNINKGSKVCEIVRVIKKEVPEGPHEVLLTIDATTGQNGILQADYEDQVRAFQAL